jgi:hypothetical protein
MLALFLQTLNVTAPVFAMLFLGYGLKRIEWINDNFIKTASALVFNVCMPSLLFLGIYHADLRSALNPGLLGYFVVATVGSFAIAWWIATKRCPEVDRGVFTQGAFRGNNGVIGLALAGSMYGDYGISLGSILAGLVIVLYNSLSVVVLAIYSPNIKSDPLSICKSILVNPLIISVALAVPFAWLQVPIPNWILTSADYVAQMSLPLHRRHSVTGGAAQQWLGGLERQCGENDPAADRRYIRCLAVGLSRGGTGHSVPVYWRSFGLGRLCHGAGQRRQLFARCRHHRDHHPGGSHHHQYRNFPIAVGRLDLDAACPPASIYPLRNRNG